MSEDAETRRQMLRRACSAVGLSTHGSVETLLKRLEHGRMPGKAGRKRSFCGNVPDEFEIAQRTHLAASYITNHDEQTAIIRRMWANRLATECKRTARSFDVLFWEKLDNTTAADMRLCYLGKTTKDGHTLHKYIPYEPIDADVDGPPAATSQNEEAGDDDKEPDVTSERAAKTLKLLKSLLKELRESE